jgi:hypothetical protein
MRKPMKLLPKIRVFGHPQNAKDGPEMAELQNP